jgi:hypothetical protein
LGGTATSEEYYSKNIRRQFSVFANEIDYLIDRFPTYIRAGALPRN